MEDKTTCSIEETTQSAEKGKKRKSDLKESGEKKKAKNVSSDNSINTPSEKDAESEKNVAELVPKETNSSKVELDDSLTIGTEAKTENNSGEKPKKKKKKHNISNLETPVTDQSLVLEDTLNTSKNIKKKKDKDGSHDINEARKKVE